MVLCFVFFFKQKTAYEMRISDWSSDVCSSDLGVVHEDGDRTERVPHHAQALLDRGPIADVDGHPDRRAAVGGDLGRRGVSRVAVEVEDRDLGAVVGQALRDAEADARCAPRSEEHTSELQSLMRISYAVFCLTKKTRDETQKKNSNK